MIAGTVKHVDAKDWKNGIFLYHFTLEGSPVVHNCGTTNPNVQPGETICFKTVNRKVDVKTIERVSEEKAKALASDQSPSSSGPSPATSSPSMSSSPSSGDVGRRIQRQEARHDAIRLVCAAMENKLLPYPQSGKNEDKWSRMLDLINETTNDLIEMEDEWTTRS